jgi:fused signal recognition particle receptor
MFGKLKEKLKNWTKKISEKSEVIEEKEELEEEFVPDKEDLKKLEEASEIKNEIKVPIIPGASAKTFVADFDKLKEIKKDLEKVEEIKKENLEKEPEEKPGTESFFKKVTSRIKKVKISEKEFDVYAEDLEMLLLENNVAIEVTEKIIRELKDRIIGKEFLKKEVESEIKDFFREIIEEILVEPYDFAERVKSGDKPYVILFCGINGTGKTTTVAKVADYLKGKNLSCVLAAGDTFRAASIEQLQTHGERLGVKVIAHEYGSDPASVGYDAIAYAKKNKIDCVLIDTAGRMHTAKNLLKEMEKIVKVCKPDLKIFVGESITGNDILEQVRSFDWAIGIDGIVLSKADIDEKGGTALSVGYVTKKPILYLGTGQEYDKFEPFDRRKFIERLGL